MIIIRIQGGLGNQLYEYAIYKKFEQLGKEVYLDNTDYTDRAIFHDKRDLELDYFDSLSYKLCSAKQRSRLVDDKRTFFARARRKIFGSYSKIYREIKDYMPEVFEEEDKYLIGWWNCEKYYEDMIPFLQQEIIFPDRYNEKTKELLRHLFGKDNTVSIHIRLGDYVEKSSTYGNICTTAYYQTAINYITEHVKNSEFYLFSDDPAGALKILSDISKRAYNSCKVVDFNTGKNSMYDMLIQSRCAHNICANSTFSMWGARLNQNPDKIMIRSLKHDNNQHFAPEYMINTWKNWLLIDEKGKIYGRKNNLDHNSSL